MRRCDDVNNLKVFVSALLLAISFLRESLVELSADKFFAGISLRDLPSSHRRVFFALTLLTRIRKVGGGGGGGQHDSRGKKKTKMQPFFFIRVSFAIKWGDDVTTTTTVEPLLFTLVFLHHVFFVFLSLPLLGRKKILPVEPLDDKGILSSLVYISTHW